MSDTARHTSTEIYSGLENKKENALKLDEEHKNSIKKTKEMGIVIKRIEKGEKK